MPGYEIHRATTQAHLQDAARLMQAYKAELGLAVFDNPGQRADEILPGPYGAPDAGILLGYLGDEACGVVAFKGVGLVSGRASCEMKRMFVVPAARGTGLGRALALAVMTQAREAGHCQMVLDSLPHLEPALGLYCSLGFAPIARYNDNPVDGVVFYGADLG